MADSDSDVAPRPSQVLAERLSTVRKRRGLTAKGLSERLRSQGVDLGRVAIAKIEGGQRGVSLDEALALAYALDVAPIYLFLPLADNEEVTIANTTVHAPHARAWVNGRWPLPNQDDRFFYTETDDETFESRKRQAALTEEWRERAALGDEEAQALFDRVPKWMHDFPHYFLAGEEQDGVH
jgi:transcriptional regulator with XRE-family HTH domain